jgi:hypothetical protein
VDAPADTSASTVTDCAIVRADAIGAHASSADASARRAQAAAVMAT